MEEKTGLYMGTEINEQWWRRYAEDKFLARGNGRYWIDHEAFCFLRYLTKSPIRIPFADIMAFKTGKWHAGRWAAGCPVLKIVWLKKRQRLSSGFLISKDPCDLENLIAQLKAI